MTNEFPFSKLNDPGKVQCAAPFPARIRNPITLIFLWASKTDPQLVALCSPWSISTQAALGVFAFFTAILAFGAVYCALSTLNAPVFLVPWIAIGWSLFMLCLEREIVGSLDKRSAILRPFLSLIIGVLLAVPIELWIFSQRIDQELQSRYRQDNAEQFDNLRSAETALEQRRADLLATLTELRRQEAEWGKVLDDELVGRQKTGRSGVPGHGPVFDNASRQQQSVHERIEETRRDLDQVERSMPDERRRLERQFQREELRPSFDFITRYEALSRLVRSSDALYRMSWGITLALIMIEMQPAVLKLFTPHGDYHRLVQADIRESIALINSIATQNYRRANKNPDSQEESVSRKFSRLRLRRDRSE